MKKLRRSLLICILLLTTVACSLLAACGGSVKLTFHTNGGDAIEAVSVDKGEEYVLPEAQREGYGFLGWYLDSELTDGPVEKVVAEKNQDFYAKWEQLYKLTLVLDGGTLNGASGSVDVWLKAGTALSTFLKDYVPEKTGHQFAAWYNGETQLTSSATMGQEALTLTAHYKVSYTVALYLQNLEQTGYVKADEDYVGYEFAGTNLLPTPKVNGFTQIDHASASKAKTLSENPAENTFTLYFDRNEIEVAFFSNAPGEDDYEVVTMNVLFGAQLELPGNLFTADGYVLSAWATTPGGVDAIATNYVQRHAFNADNSLEVPQVSVGSEDMLFYGVWTKAYVDMFDGEDSIYHFGDEETDIYLCRAGQYFKGTYTARTRTFRFVNQVNNRTILEGRLNEDGTFIYRDEKNVNFTRTLYVFGQGIDESTRIFFDAYDGIKYVVTNEGGGTNDSEGTYHIDEYGYYVATFTTGDMAGRTITFITGTAGGYEVFAIRDDTEAGWGVMHRVAVNGSSLTYYTQAYVLQLNGFGTAAMVSASGSVETYSYEREGDEFTLRDASNNVYLIARHLVLQDTELYAVYNASYDHTYTAKDGSTLELDGMYNATYTSGGVTVHGYYTQSSSAFGSLIRIVTPEGSYLFLAKSERRTEYDEDGKSTTVYDYTFERKPTSYAAYYYCDTAFSSAMLVILDEDEVGKVTVYGRNGNSEYEKVLLGSYVYDEKTGIYSVTVLVNYDFSDTVAVNLYDYSRVAAFTFSTDIYISSTIFGTYAYPVTYWHTVTMAEEEPTDFEDVYTEAEGDGRLIIVGAFATLEWNDIVISGQYSLSDGFMVITPYGSSASVYIEIDEEEHTFIVLADMLGTAYRLSPQTGSRVATETLTFDGKGGVVYSYNTTEGGDTVTHTYEGTYEATGELSEGGAGIYVFTSLDGNYTFRFILLSSSSYTYFAREGAEYSGTFTSEDEDTLTLDGFGFYAKYTPLFGTPIEGQYVMPDENSVYFIYAGSYAVWFDLDGNTFTTRGGEYGEDYILIDNNGSRGIYYAFDGYGHLTVYRYEDDAEAEDGYRKVILDAEGTYSRTEENIVLNYVIGDEHITVYGLFGTLTQSGYVFRVFIQEHKEVVRVYINRADWSVLILDAYGTLTKHSATGLIETGMYLLISDNLLYYVKSDGSDACLFRYDRTDGTVTEIRYDARGYFTRELDALLFSEAGFMVEGGETRYYYELDGEGNVILWHQDWDDASHNEYGFVKTDDFGKFEDTKVIDGKEYFVNTGYAIVFKRGDETAEKYPITLGYQYVLDENGDRIKDEDGQYVIEAVKASLDQLSFTPTGAAEFAVRGTVVINGTNATCTVYRILNEEDGTYRMYITIPTSGAGKFVFDINVSYTGDSASDTSDNRYEITAMQVETNLYSSMYFQYYYIYYMMFGVQIGNSFGYINIVNEYDEAGDVVEEYLNGAFGGSSGMFDTNGNLVQLEHVEYTYENGTYTVEIENEDGYVYYLRFSINSQFTQIFGEYSYDLVAFTRVEKFEMENGYRLEVERIVASDNYSTGDYWNIKLFKDETELTPTTVYIYNNTLYFIVRATDEDGKIIGDEYYIISLTGEEVDLPSVDGPEDGELEEDPDLDEDQDEETPDIDDGEDEEGDAEEVNRNPLPVFTDASVRYVNTVTYYSADETNYVDIAEEEHEVLMIVIGRTVYLVESSEYNAETGVYTVTTLGGNKTFTVKVTEGVVEVTEVTVEAQD